MRKIRVFLGAYVNNVSAFNLNCRAIAKNIDKNNFEVYTLTLSSGDLNLPHVTGIHYFNCFWPAKISKYLGFIWGIANCDVAYLPRGNHYKYNKILLKLFNKKSFKRQGNVIDEAHLKEALSIVGNIKNITDSYNYCDKVFAPSKFVGRKNFYNWGIKYDKHTYLPPMIDTSSFSRKINYRSTVKKVAFIGNDMERKNIKEFFDLSAHFPLIEFHVIGSGIGKAGIEKIKFDRQLKNLVYHGAVSPEELNIILQDIDLHILPSKSEGFGKVTVETAAVGIPSIVYDSYGAGEWLENGIEGVVVSNFEEMKATVDKLSTNSDSYHKLISGTISLTEKFDITNRIKTFEKVVEDLYYDK